MKVSIIMLTHNRLELTKQCLYNLFKNTEQEYELVVVDDFSKDGTTEYLRENKDEIDKLIFNKEHKGIPQSINTAISNCTGDLILDFLPDDDILPKGWLTNLLDAKKSVPKNSVISPMRHVFDIPDNSFTETIKHKMLSYEDFINNPKIKFWEDWYFLKTVANPNLTKEKLRSQVVEFNGHTLYQTLSTGCHLMPLEKEIYKKIGMRRTLTKYGRNDADFMSRLHNAGYKSYLLISLKPIDCTKLDWLLYPKYRQWKTDTHEQACKIWQ